MELLLDISLFMKTKYQTQKMAEYHKHMIFAGTCQSQQCKFLQLMGSCASFLFTMRVDAMMSAHLKTATKIGCGVHLQLSIKANTVTATCVSYTTIIQHMNFFVSSVVENSHLSLCMSVSLRKRVALSHVLLKLHTCAPCLHLGH